MFGDMNPVDWTLSIWRLELEGCEGDIDYAATDLGEAWVKKAAFEKAGLNVGYLDEEIEDTEMRLSLAAEQKRKAEAEIVAVKAYREQLDENPLRMRIDALISN